MNELDAALFDGCPRGAVSRAVRLAGIIALFALGLAHWYLFMNGGDIPFNVQDWSVNYANYSVLRQALTTGTVPYHTSVPFMSATDRFFSIPEISLSPQVLMLRFLPLNGYFLANTFVMFAAGFWGCLLIMRRFRLSLFSFAALFMLFNFNGFITSHLAIGHAAWFGYFILPFFCLFVLEMGEPEYSFARSFWKLPAAMFLLMLQGSLHIFVWCGMFLVLYGLFNLRQMKYVLAVLLMSAALSSFRILPGAMAMSQLHQPFMVGYPNVAVFLDSLINIRDFSYRWAGQALKTLNWWEYDMYIDIIGAAFITFFGIIARRPAFKGITGRDFAQLDFPLLVMAFLSFNYVYWFLRQLPLLGSERVLSRIMILPLLFLIVISCARLQEFLSKRRPGAMFKACASGALAVMSLSLAIHSRAWSILVIKSHFGDAPRQAAVSIITRADPSYVMCVKASAAATLLSLALLAAAAVYFARLRRTAIV